MEVIEKFKLKWDEKQKNYEDDDDDDDEKAEVKDSGSTFKAESLPPISVENEQKVFESFK